MLEKDIEHIRDFNRFYTSIIGLLDKHVVNSPYALPEARLLFELYHHQPCSASDLIASTRMDKGYVSRILKSFEKKGLLIKKQNKEDGRAFQIGLSAKGEKEFAKINVASSDQIKSLFGSLSKEDITQLLDHMREIKSIVAKASTQ